MENSSDTRAYLRAHHGRLDEITARIDVLNAAAPHPVVVEQREGEPLRLETGAYTPASVLADQEVAGLRLTWQQAVRRAEALNGGLLTGARISIMSILTAATIYRRHLDAQQHAAADPPAGEPLSLLSYQKASWRRIEHNAGDSDVTICTARINQAEAYNAVHHYLVQLSDGQVHELLDIFRADETFFFVSHQTQAAQDVFRRRAQQIMQGDYVQLTPLLAGIFKDKAELKTKLDAIRQPYQGTAKEQEVNQLLKEVQQNAWATKESKRLLVQHNLHLPDLPTLKKFKNLLFA